MKLNTSRQTKQTKYLYKTKYKRKLDIIVDGDNRNRNIMLAKHCFSIIFLILVSSKDQVFIGLVATMVVWPLLSAIEMA